MVIIIVDWELNRKEKPTIEKINMFFEYQSIIMSNISNWIEIGLKWDRNKSKFKNLKTKDYNKFLIEMDKYLFFSGYRLKRVKRKVLVKEYLVDIGIGMIMIN